MRCFSYEQIEAKLKELYNFNDLTPTRLRSWIFQQGKAHRKQLYLAHPAVYTEWLALQLRKSCNEKVIPLLASSIDTKEVAALQASLINTIKTLKSIEKSVGNLEELVPDEQQQASLFEKDLGI